MGKAVKNVNRACLGHRKSGYTESRYQTRADACYKLLIKQIYSGTVGWSSNATDKKWNFLEGVFGIGFDLSPPSVVPLRTMLSWTPFTYERRVEVN